MLIEQSSVEENQRSPTEIVTDQQHEKCYSSSQSQSQSHVPHSQDSRYTITFFLRKVKKIVQTQHLVIQIKTKDSIELINLYPKVILKRFYLFRGSIPKYEKTVECCHLLGGRVPRFLSRDGTTPHRSLKTSGALVSLCFLYIACASVSSPFFL